MRSSQTLILVAFIGILNNAVAQKNIKLHADIYSGFNKLKSEKKDYIGNTIGNQYQTRSYNSPAPSYGFGVRFELRNWHLGFDYLLQRYNWKQDSKVTDKQTGEISESKYVTYDEFHIKRLNLGYDFFKKKRCQSTLVIGYAFPAINFWGFRRGYSAVYNAKGEVIDKYWTYMCRASGYSISLNTGITSKDQKSKISLTLGSEWLSNNTPKRFESHWMRMEKKEWYYSAGLRYSYLLKAWGKK